mmetsp:Transcript_9753/g.36318  ORF Transcript_9753/g.36318 Transcript_9753/m.36318 type:complete len:290 (+) Transcript_9753:978-1847(+)
MTQSQLVQNLNEFVIALPPHSLEQKSMFVKEWIPTICLKGKIHLLCFVGWHGWQLKKISKNYHLHTAKQLLAAVHIIHAWVLFRVCAPNLPDDKLNLVQQGGVNHGNFIQHNTLGLQKTMPNVLFPVSMLKHCLLAFRTTSLNTQESVQRYSLNVNGSNSSRSRHKDTVLAMFRSQIFHDFPQKHTLACSCTSCAKQAHVVHHNFVNDKILFWRHVVGGRFCLVRNDAFGGNTQDAALSGTHSCMHKELLIALSILLKGVAYLSLRMMRRLMRGNMWISMLWRNSCDDW